MNRKQTRKIVEGAFMLALLGVFITIDSYTAGMLTILIYFFIPLPLIWYGNRYGQKNLMLLSFCSIIIGLFLGLPEMIFYLVCGNLIANVVTFGIRKKVSSMTMFLMMIGISIVSNILLYTLFSGLFGYDMNEFQGLFEFINNNMQYIEITESYDVFLKIAVPLIIILFGIVEGYVFMSIMVIVLNRLKIPFVKSFHIVHMRLPKWYGILACVCIIIDFLISQQIMTTVWYYMFSYLSILSIFSLMLQGVSFLGVYLIVKGNNRYFIFVMLLLLIPMANYILIPFGLLDIFSEKRKDLLYNK